VPEGAGRPADAGQADVHEAGGEFERGGCGTIVHDPSRFAVAMWYTLRL
jgi:hypothetical protein